MKKKLKCLCTVAVTRLVRLSSSLAWRVVNDWNRELQAADALFACGELGIQGTGNHRNDSTLGSARNFSVARGCHGNVKLYDVDRCRPRSLQASLILWHSTDVIRGNARARRPSTLNRSCNLNQTITYEIF